MVRGLLRRVRMAAAGLQICAFLLIADPVYANAAEQMSGVRTGLLAWGAAPEGMGTILLPMLGAMCLAGAIVMLLTSGKK